MLLLQIGVNGVPAVKLAAMVSRQENVKIVHELRGLRINVTVQTGLANQVHNVSRILIIKSR